MSDSVGTGLLVVLSVIALIGVVLIAAAAYLIAKYRLPLRGIVATLASLAYVLSPVDAVPEFPLGPIGLVDDLAVIVGALLYIYRLLDSRGRELTDDTGGTSRPGDRRRRDTRPPILR